jgi:hypothetical protein
MTITLLEDVRAGQALVAVDNPTEASLDQVFRIDDEIVVVRNDPSPGGKLVLGRGIMGSSRAAHAAGSELASDDGDVLQIVAGHQAFAAPAGGGEPVAVMSLTTTLTDADIKTLKTPHIIVPGPGAGQFVDFVRIVLVTDIVFGEGYAGVSPTGLFVVGLGAGNMDIAYVQNDSSFSSGMITDLFTRSSVTLIGPGQDVASSTETTQPFGTFIHADVSGDLTLKLDQASNLTGGNAANTLKVTVLYTVIDL